MNQRIDAVDGLEEQEQLRATITPDDRDNFVDDDFGIEHKNPGTPSLEDVRSALASIEGPMDEAINELRGEF